MDSKKRLDIYKSLQKGFIEGPNASINQELAERQRLLSPFIQRKLEERQKHESELYKQLNSPISPEEKAEQDRLSLQTQDEDNQRRELLKQELLKRQEQLQSLPPSIKLDPKYDREVPIPSYKWKVLGDK